MPSLSHHCEYASMLTHAFQHYFVEGLAWEPEMPCCESEVVLIIAQDSTNDNHQKNADICKVRIIHRI